MLVRAQMNPGLPIGVFDSGLGGLSVLKALTTALPNEDFIYLGDIARLPYGTKSKSVVSRYAQTCAAFLKNRGIKALVVACNTATAMALEDLEAEEPFPVYGVIKPGVQACLEEGAKRVLVLATEATVRSEAYPREFYRVAADIEVTQLACPLLVPLAEQGWFEGPVAEAVLNEYLKPYLGKGFDTVLMGCTHYPLLRHTIQKVVGSETRLVHGAEVLSRLLKEKLVGQGLVKDTQKRGEISFYATDRIAGHLPLVSSLFSKACDFQIVDL